MEDQDLYASEEELENAIETLSNEAQVRLLKYARDQTYKIPWLSREDGGEDLIQEAITRILDPQKMRNWKILKVDFEQHLKGVIRSIADSWRKKEQKAPRVLETNGTRDHLSAVPTEAPSASRIIIAKQKVEQIFEEFTEKDDSEVLCILELMSEGEKGKTIQEVLGINRNTYETIMKRLRRAVRKRGQKWPIKN